ncbi:alanine racemase [Alkalicoccus chagannorensis]
MTTMKAGPSFYRDTWADIDMDAVEENVAALRSHLPEKTGIMAVVKADGYGHGAVHTAKAALRAGADQLAVAMLDEALELRQAGMTAPILVMGYSRPEDAAAAAAYDITLTAYAEAWLDALALDGIVDVHVKLDSGMNRLGLKQVGEIRSFGRKAAAHDSVRVTGAFTHFAASDEKDLSFTREQLEQFTFQRKTLEETTGTLDSIHAANSAAAMRVDEAALNTVRFGISMYGLNPSAEIQSDLPFPLKRAFTLKSRVTHCKHLQRGETVSYGRSYKAERDMWTATVPIGYADGWIRAHQDGDVLINGRRARIIGRICMDQMMIEVEEPVETGEEVVLIGRQGGEEITMDEVAGRVDTISYEVPCIISSRVPRVILINGEQVEVRSRFTF